MKVSQGELTRIKCDIQIRCFPIIMYISAPVYYSYIYQKHHVFLQQHVPDYLM